MDATKRPTILPLTCYWSEHFSTWVIRDGDNHQIGQVDNEKKGRLIVTAVNNFDEMVEALIHLKEELVQFHGNVHGKCTDQGPTTCPTWEAIHKARALLAKLKEG